MIHRLGKLEPFLAVSMALDKSAQFGMAPGEVGTREYGG
jgi:hypothetical protein